MASKALPAPEVLRQLLRYEPDTGRLFWRARTPDLFRDTKSKTAAHACNWWNTRFADKEAFLLSDSKGYKQSSIFDYPHQAQRVIWAMQTGAWSVTQIDHADGNPENNKWTNLRQASRSQNQHNKGLPKNNTSGVKGVSWCKRREKWHVAIRHNYQTHNVGYFADITEAESAAIAARNSLHGEFAKHG